MIDLINPTKEALEAANHLKPGGRAMSNSTKERKEFIEWFCEGEDFPSVLWDETLDIPESEYTRFAWSAWKAQQQRIDDLQTRIENQDFILVELKEHSAKTVDLLASEVADLQRQHAELKQKYNDLLYQVSIKHPDESRHETAKRYIINAEKPTDNCDKALAAGE